MCHVLVLREISWISRDGSIEHPTYYFRRKVISSTWYPTDFEIKLAGKIVSIEVEVIDAPLDYNLLLERSWNYTMSSMVERPLEQNLLMRLLLHVSYPCLVGKLLDIQSWFHQTPYLLLSTEGHFIHIVSYHLSKLSWQGKQCLLR